MSRLFKDKGYWITQGYHSRHTGVDMTAEGGFDYVTAHTEGKIVQVINYININTSGDTKFGSNKKLLDSRNPGNMIVIEHPNGYRTRYLHLQYGSIERKVGDTVKTGEVIGYMGNTGYSFGAHLHFDMYNDKGVKIDPTDYLDKDLPNSKEEEKKGHDIGDSVEINGVYVSSMSENKLNPAITKGTITRIIPNARNPYLLNNGNIGWINEDCIVKTVPTGKVYVIKEGDTLSGIAQKFGTTWQNLFEKNSDVIGGNPNLIYPGTKIII